MPKDSNLKPDLSTRHVPHLHLNGTKKNEGLKFGCTAKGDKVGTIYVNFMVGISFDKGVLLCGHYRNTITSQKMEQIIRDAMPEALENRINPNSKRILMDSCPRQNSKLE